MLARMRPPRLLSFGVLAGLLALLLYSLASAQSRSLEGFVEAETERRKAELQRATEALGRELDQQALAWQYELQQAAQVFGLGGNPRLGWQSVFPKYLVVKAYACQGDPKKGGVWYSLPPAGRPVRMTTEPGVAQNASTSLIPLPLNRSRLVFQMESVFLEGIPKPMRRGSIVPPASTRIRFILVLDGARFISLALREPASRLLPAWDEFFFQVGSRQGNSLILSPLFGYATKRLSRPSDASVGLLQAKELNAASAEIQERTEGAFTPSLYFSNAKGRRFDDHCFLEVWAANGPLDRLVNDLFRFNRWVITAEYAGLGLCGLLLIVLGLRAQRLAAAQADFVSSISHELRTPLAVIRSAAQNLDDGLVTDPAQVRAYGATLSRGALRLQELVDRVLILSRLRRARLQTRAVALRPLIDWVVAERRGDLEEKGIELEVRAPPDLPTVRGNEEALEAAVRNLLDNAIKYGGGGGKIAIEAARHPRRPKRVRLTVRDWGPGLSRGERRHLSRPFFRGRLAHEKQLPGTGLGLAVVDRIARALGGRLTSDNASPGAAFHLDLARAGALS